MSVCDFCRVNEANGHDLGSGGSIPVIVTLSTGEILHRQRDIEAGMRACGPCEAQYVKPTPVPRSNAQMRICSVCHRMVRHLEHGLCLQCVGDGVETED